jgi:hypothetical protein
MSRTTYGISWRTRDRRLIHRVCTYLGISPSMSVNRITRIRQLTEVQRQALQPLIDNRSIDILHFTS